MLGARKAQNAVGRGCEMDRCLRPVRPTTLEVEAAAVGRAVVAAASRGPRSAQRAFLPRPAHNGHFGEGSERRERRDQNESPKRSPWCPPSESAAGELGAL